MLVLTVFFSYPLHKRVLQLNTRASKILNVAGHDYEPVNKRNRSNLFVNRMLIMG